MVEVSAKRIVAIAALAGAAVGGAVAGTVAVLSTNNNNGGASSGDPNALSTVSVVRTTLSTTEQVGGSISYEGSYSIAYPSGSSAQQVAADQQAVTLDQQSLSADQQDQTDASNSDDQAITAAQAGVNGAQSTLGADQASQSQSCAGAGGSSAACSQDQQRVSQDQSQLTQAQQQLANAQSSATRDHDQNQAKVQADQTKLQGDQASLASAQASATSPGTSYTALPAVGDVIKEDQSVFSVSNEPVPLVYGAIPAYHAFYVGMSDGPDVGELTQDLIALGDGASLTQSNHFSSATAAAVDRWQSALGLPATGQILLGQAVFEPGAIRVTAVTPSVGESTGSGGGQGGGGGTVLTATSTTPIVTVDLDVSQEYLVKPGDAVSIVLPDGTTTVGGHVETVGTVATCPGGAGSGTGPGSGSGSADQSPCSSGGSNNTPTVPVTISMDSDPSGANFDQAPVNVDITSQQASNVLAVPVNALLALQGGGFGVDVVTGKSSRLVGITPGLYANSMVQISGSGITVGTRVEVPSS